MNVAIFGEVKIARSINEAIWKVYNPFLQQNGRPPLNVAAFIDNPANWGGQAENVAVLNLVQFALLYHRGVFDKIIILRDLQGQGSLRPLLSLKIRPEDILIVNRLDGVDVNNFIEPYLSAKFLPYLEFHVADHCNLNCKACEHYSGLVKKPRFPNLKKFTQDFEQLHKFIDDIRVIRILGGEPLLNTEINSYVELSRRLYPKAIIYVVTNALLLQKMPEDFFETLNRCGALIHISFYLPLEEKMPEILKLLEDKKVRYSVSPLNKTFTMKQTLQPHDKPQEIFAQCFQAHCNNLYEGKIASCFLPFTTKYFNKYYNKNLPESGAVDLYDENLTTEKLKRHLLTSFERCRYCSLPVDVEWKQIAKPSPLSDWVTDA